MTRRLDVNDLLGLEPRARSRILDQLPGRLATGSDVLSVTVTPGGRVLAVRHYLRRDNLTLVRDADGEGVKVWTPIGGD